MRVYLRLPRNRVSDTYGGKSFRFGRDYLIPKPFDSRVLLWVAPAVAKAAMDSKVATREITDWDVYRDQLEAFQGPSKAFVRGAIHRVHQNSQEFGAGLPRIVFPEGTSTKILKAIKTLVDEKICQPILLGYPDRIQAKIHSLDLKSLTQVPIIHPSKAPQFKNYVQELYCRRQRKGINLTEAERLMSDPNYYASMMVLMGDADGMVTGSSQDYADAVRPILQVIGLHKEGVPAGVNFVLTENRMFLLTDTTVNINPSAEQLAQIALQDAKVAEYFGLVPKIAMLSYSNFTGQSGTPAKMKKAAELVSQLRPWLICDAIFRQIQLSTLKFLSAFSPSVT